MNRNKLKTYAPQARRDFIQAVTDRAGYFGLTAKKAESVTVTGDVAKIGGRPFPKSVAEQRKALDERVAKLGFEQVMEAVAYTWFNRLVAIRFMELHGYLDHGYRVLSHPEGKPTPEIVEHAEHVELPGLDKQKVIDLKLEGNKEEELYRILLIAQCNALHDAMPFLFERINDETELLLPTNLLHSDSLIRTLVNEIEETDWQEVEIIGWLYQFYISDKKDQVIGKVVASEDIPAATQLFTPNWIVKYLVQNTLGRQWLATYPQSSLRQQMDYYIEPAEQTPEVQEQLKAITPASLNPEELTLLDPACGSGHILVEAYDLFKAIYQERGYRAKDIPAFILQKNLFGLEIDDRAAQLASFALMMKARADDRRIFDGDVKPNILAFQDSQGMNANEITEAVNSSAIHDDVSERVSQSDISLIIELFRDAKTLGSLIHVPPLLKDRLPVLSQRLNTAISHAGMLEQAEVGQLMPLVSQAILLAKSYDSVVANPPYMNSKAMPPSLKRFATQNYPESKTDVFSMFISRSLEMISTEGMAGLVTPMVWMFLSTYEAFRDDLLGRSNITSLVQLEYNAFEPACVPVCAFCLTRTATQKTPGTFIRLCAFRGSHTQSIRTLEAIHDTTCKWRFNATTEDFRVVVGHPIIYWLGQRVLSLFSSHAPFGQVCKARRGLTTWNNERFLRLWFEIPASRFLPMQEPHAAIYWVPYNKGGPARRWGNNSLICVWWANDGADIKELGPPTGEEWYFKPGITWSGLTSSAVTFRYSPPGFMFDSNKGSMMFPDARDLYVTLGFLNSSLSYTLLNALNPTLSTQNYDIDRLPFVVPDLDRESLTRLVNEAIRISNDDWDSDETSWSFIRHPLLNVGVSEHVGLQESINALMALYVDRRNRLQDIESAIDRSILESCGLRAEWQEYTPSIDIQLRERSSDGLIRSLLSYAIGCMMGRYSLDEPGLVYAHHGNQGFDASRYATFPADDDGIIPITELHWFEDDAASRFEKFVATVFPANSFTENLVIVAKNLGSRKDESPSETIRRYFTADFYKDHLQSFKGPKHPPRPIYWMFSSGKHRAFQALVYLHRYNEGTLARMRTEYVIPLLGKMASRIAYLTDDIAATSSTQHRKRLEKEKDKVVKQMAELRSYDEQLRHYADLQIRIALDDGVRANYGKFGNLLADAKVITSGGGDE